MKRALYIVLAVAVVLAVIAPLATTASADGPRGYGHGYSYVFPDSGYNKVCMYSYWNCSYRFVPPAPISGYYKYPYDTYYTPKSYDDHKSSHYNPGKCQRGLLCGQTMKNYGGNDNYGWNNNYSW